MADAESTPPPRIWENLDTILENQELHHYRKQAKWYRSIAAAALLLLISFSIFLWKNGATPATQPQESLASTAITNNAPAQPESNQPAPTAKKPVEKLAAVSGTFSGKQGQNRNLNSKPLGAGRIYERKPGTETTNAIAHSGSNQARISQKLQEAPNNFVTPTAAGTLASAEAKGSVEELSALAGRVGEINALAVTADSVQPARAKTILLQKQAETSAVAVVTPAEKEEKNPTGTVQRWSLAVAYSPQYAYAPVKLGQASNAPMASFSQPEMANEYQEAVNEYNNSYSPTYSYSTMVGASYQINEKWQLESGFLYTQNEAKTSSSFLVSGGAGSRNQSFDGLALATSAKNVPLVANALHSDASPTSMSVSRTTQYNTRYKYQQLGLPLRVAYRHNLKKFFGYLAGGVHVNLLLQNSITPETMQVEALRFSFKDKDSPYKAWQFATSTSLGLGYEVSKNMSLIVAPELNYSLTPLLREEQQQTDAYQLGVSIGGRWRLGK